MNEVEEMFKTTKVAPAGKGHVVRFGEKWGEEYYSIEYYNEKGENDSGHGGPAMTFTEGGQAGTMYWFKNGVIHRDDDLPAIINGDGSLTWCQNGKAHREGNFARMIYHEDCKQHSFHWCIKGKAHREDGPANIWPIPMGQWNKKHEFCLKDRYYSIEEYYELCKDNIKMSREEFFMRYDN